MGRKPMLVLKIPLDIAEKIVESLQSQINEKNNKVKKVSVENYGSANDPDESMYFKYNKALNDLWIEKCWSDSLTVCKSFKAILEGKNRKGLDAKWFGIERKIIAQTLHMYPEIDKSVWIKATAFLLEDPFLSQNVFSFKAIVRNFHKYLDKNKSSVSNDIYLKFKSQVI